MLSADIRGRVQAGGARNDCPAGQACAGSYQQVALPLPAGKTWRFGASLYTGVAYLDNYADV